MVDGFIHTPWDAPHLFRMAQLAISGVKRRGKEPTYLSLHPDDWDLIVAFCRKMEGRPRSQPKLKLYEFPVRLAEDESRGDVRAVYAPEI